MPWLAAALLCATLATGCTYRRVIHDDMDTWRAMATKNQATSDSPITTPDFHAQSQRGGWTIELARFSGTHRFASAQRLVQFLKDKTALADAWVHDTGSECIVMRGRFPAADAPGADALLHETRELAIDDTKRFEKARLIPWGSAAADAAEQPADLAQFAGMQGYTLQIAFFDKAGGKSFREAAETYCRQLREKGEQAYFYHGPNRSMVTLGLFTDADWQGQGIQKHYGPRIRELQERFPHNLGNGATIVERVNGQLIGDQPSVLVHLPR